MHAARVYRLSDSGMAMAAGAFHDFAVEAGDLNCVRVFTGSEVKRVEETVARFDRIFAQEIMRCMAVIARRRPAMTGLDPARVLLVHGVTVGARGGIVQEIGIAFGVNKCVATNADEHADQDRQHQFQPRHFHGCLSPILLKYCSQNCAAGRADHSPAVAASVMFKESSIFFLPGKPDLLARAVIRASMGNAASTAGYQGAKTNCWPSPGITTLAPA